MKSVHIPGNLQGKDGPKNKYRRSINKATESKFFFLVTILMLLAGMLYKISGILVEG